GGSRPRAVGTPRYRGYADSALSTRRGARSARGFRGRARNGGGVGRARGAAWCERYGSGERSESARPGTRCARLAIGTCGKVDGGARLSRPPRAGALVAAWRHGRTRRRRGAELAPGRAFVET